MKRIITVILFFSLAISICPAQQLRIINPVRILALGDSYTIGQSVLVTERWPAQLADSLVSNGFEVEQVDYRAMTGWTSSNLLTSLENEAPSRDYTLVTLLIGVNNQFNRQDIENYAKDLDVLIQKSLSYTRQIQSRVLILSIPDYGFTPFGENLLNVSEEIDEYNEIIDSLSSRYGIPYINITDISRRGLEEPELLAFDDLHPSKFMYAEWVERILQNADLSFIVTGLEDLNDKIQVYPNPFKDQITVDSQGENVITLYSIRGEVLLEQEFLNNARLDLRNWPSGIYFYGLNTNGVITREVLIKE